MLVAIPSLFVLQGLLPVHQHLALADRVLYDERSFGPSGEKWTLLCGPIREFVDCPMAMYCTYKLYQTKSTHKPRFVFEKGTKKDWHSNSVACKTASVNVASIRNYQRTSDRLHMRRFAEKLRIINHWEIHGSHEKWRLSSGTMAALMR